MAPGVYLKGSHQLIISIRVNTGRAGMQGLSARLVLFIPRQPAHVQIPRRMILPEGHEVQPSAMSKINA
jgi:hypothetical protein